MKSRLPIAGATARALAQDTPANRRRELLKQNRVLQNRVLDLTWQAINPASPTYDETQVRARLAKCDALYAYLRAQERRFLALGKGE